MKKLFKTLLFLVLPLSIMSCGPKADPEVYATRVTLNKETLAMDVDTTYQLVAHAYDKDGNEINNPNFQYFTSDESSVTVSPSGLITAKKSGGYAAISVISDTQNAVCRVNVNGPDIPELESLRFSPDTVKIRIGSSYTPNLVTYPADITGLEYHWYSNDESIVSCEDNGKIIGRGIGSTIVRAAYGDISATLNVTVEESGGGEFSITLNRSNLSLSKGASFQLEATTSREATIKWSSSNASVASVENGKVTALKKGSATITAATDNLDDQGNPICATCSVNVFDGDVPPGEPDLKVFFYIDYNNIETPYGYEEGLDWYIGYPLKDNKPEDPTTPPDPAFPYFGGWSSHTIIDETKDLWNFDSDVVPEGVYTFILYGIWFDEPVNN